MQNAATSKPKKKGLKMPHLLVLILSLLVLMSLMTYIIPAGQFGTDPETGAILSDQFHLLGYQTPVNPWRALTLILDGLTSSGMIIGLLLAAGGYTGVVLSTKAIDETVDYAIYKLQDKGINVLIPVVFFIYCFIGAFASGDQIIAMVPVGLMFAKKLRLDPIIGMSIVILAYFVGGLSSPTGAMLPQLTMGLELYSGFFVRFVIFLVLSTVAMLFVLRYAKRVAKDPRNSVMDPADWLDQESTGAADSLKAVELSRSSAIVVVLFLLQPIVSLILVSVIGEPRGAMVAVMLIWAFLCGKIKGLSTDEIGGRFAKGAGGMAFVGFIIGCAASMSLVMSQGNILHTIVYYACLPLKELSVGAAAIGMSFVITLINIVIPSASAKVAILCPIIQPMCETLGIPLQVGVSAFMFGDKLTNILSPFLGITVGSLALANIPYNKYAKWVLPILVILAAVSYVYLFVLAQIGWQG